MKENKRDSFGRFVKGIIPWNKGKTGIYTKEVLTRMSKAKIGKRFSIDTEFKKGNVPWNKDMKGLYIKGSEKRWIKKGWKWPENTKNKMLENLRKKILLNPNLSMNGNLAYLVGLLKGDGCIYRNNRGYKICFDNTNTTLVRNFFCSIEQLGLNPFIQEISPSNGIGKKKQYRVLANSKIFYEWYQELTIEKLENLLDNDDKISNFIRGFYEAEGCIYKQKDGTIVIQIYNTDLALMLLIKYLLQKLGLNFCLNGPYKNNGLGGYRSKPIYRLKTGSKKNIFNFLKLVKPSIKTHQQSFQALY
jgi:intein-encoded DNA endonuclease-like protein